MAVQKPRRDPRKPLPVGVQPLDPSDFSFYGFDDLRRFTFFQQVGIRSGDLKVSVADRAVFVPGSTTPRSWPARVGGIVAPNGDPIEEANLRRLGGALFAGLEGPVAVKPVRELDEDVIYLGWLLDAYGHLLLESLARTWFLREMSPSIRVVFHAARPPNPKGMTRQVLESFSIPLDRILTLDEPTRIRRVLMPEPLYELGYVAHKRAAEPHQDAASRIVRRAALSRQPLYLSRRLLASDRRTVVGEAEFEELLREIGFRIAYPETMSFADQVRLLNGHADIFACDGSAAHGVLFALSGPRLHLLVGGVASPDYFLSSTVAGASTTFVNCLDQRPGPSLGRTFPHFLNLRKITNYLYDHGFLKKQPIVDLDARIQEIQRRYDEVWLCRLVGSVGDDRKLSPEDESEARRLSTTSWPLSWFLLRHHVRHEAAIAEELAIQFAELIEAESGPERLAHYRREIARDATSTLHELRSKCDSEVVDRLTSLLGRHSMLRPQADQR